MATPPFPSTTPPGLNETLAAAIGKIVDDRVSAGFAERDTLLTSMMGSLGEVAELLRDRTRAMKIAEESRRSGGEAAQPRRHRIARPADQDLGFRTPRHALQRPSVPYRPLGGSTMTPGYFSPRRSRVRERGVLVSKKTRTGKNRLGYESKTIGGRGAKGFLVTQRPGATSLRLLGNKTGTTTTTAVYTSAVASDAPTLVSPLRDEATGTLRVPAAAELPRVARSAFHKQKGYTSPRDRVMHNENEWAKKTQQVLESEKHREQSGYDGAKTAVFRPTGFQPTRRDKEPPPKGLVLEWVYGYGRSRELASQLSANAQFHRLATSELCWPTAGLCVIFDENRMCQRFFVGHDGEVSCMAVSPHDGLTVASGQTGRGRAKVCIWSAGSWSSINMARASSPGSRRNRGGGGGGGGGSIRSPSSSGDDHRFPRYCPEICKPLQLAIGSGVAAVDFSPDGNFLMTVAMNMHHTLTLWDWRNSQPLKSVRSHSSPVYLCRFNPYQHYLFDDNEHPPEDIDPDGGGAGHTRPGERVYTCVTGGARHVKVWTIRCERRYVDDQLSPLAKQQYYNNANAGNANTGHLSTQDRALFSSLRQTGLKDVDGVDGSMSTYQRGQWRSSFKPKETDMRGIDRVGFAARQAKNCSLNETPGSKLEWQNSKTVNGHGSGGVVNKPASAQATTAAATAAAESRQRATPLEWTIEGGMCRCRRIPNVPKDELPGRDITLCCTFLPNGLHTGGACITGSSTGRITLWHQQVESGASVMIPRKNSRRGIVDRMVTGWDPVGWQGVSIPNAHGGKPVTALAAVTEQTPDRQARFLSGGKDNRVVLWDCPAGKVAEDTPRKILVLRVDAYPISILPSFNKCFVATASAGCVELDITGETPQLRPLSILDGHRHRVAAVDAYPVANVPVFATTGGDANVRLWSLRERRMMTHAMLPAAGTCVAFSADGGLLAVGTVDGAMLVYSVRAGYPPGLDLRFQDVPSRDAKNAIMTSGRDPAGGWPAPNPLNTKTSHSSRNTSQRVPEKKPNVAFGATTQSTRRQRRTAGSPRILSTSKSFATTAVKFSPDGDHLVAASRDHRLYLYGRWKDPNALPGSFRLRRVLKGHWAAVTHVDWSLDSTTIMSNGADREILYWDAAKGKQDRATLRHRDREWASWTCVLGWPVQGAWSGRQDRGIRHDVVDKAARGFMCDKFRKDDLWLEDIRRGAHGFGAPDPTSGASGIVGVDPAKQRKLAVDIINLLGASRSNSGKLLATGDDLSQVSLFRFPAVKGAKPKRYRGHGSAVSCCRFTADDRFLLTAGGQDGAVFLWSVQVVFRVVDLSVYFPFHSTQVD
jgi:WD40 repeat protein